MKVIEVFGMGRRHRSRLAALAPRQLLCNVSIGR